MMIDAEVVKSFRLIKECCKPSVLKRFVQANLTASEKLPSTKKELVEYIRNMLTVDEYDQIHYKDIEENTDNSSDAHSPADDAANEDRSDDNDNENDSTRNKRRKTGV